MPNQLSKKENSIPKEANLIEQMVGRKNMLSAYSRVMKNKGSAGIDGMKVNQLNAYLKENWAKVKEELLKGEYHPKPVKRVEIPKQGGGMRQLGIPTVMDRIIQQALNQVLTPVFDPEFSESSYGYRKGKKAHQAVLRARKYQEEGKRWVVETDLEKFFDEVNHDKLMSRIARRVKDKKILLLIRRYLQSGVMINGIVSVTDKGTPQGGPLSPLLSNIVLDDLDKELEKRGHAFCRYADDCNIYVRTKKAACRVLDSISKFVEKKLKLKVNKRKSAVVMPNQSKFLGYSFTLHKKPKLRIPSETIKRLKAKLKQSFKSGVGRNLQRFINGDLNPIIKGWINYFCLAEVKSFAEEIDGWIRRHLRSILWIQWKKPWTRRKKLIARGIKEERAVISTFNQRASWWNSGASHMNEAFKKSYFDKLGLVSMLDELCRFRSINFGNRLGT